MSSAAAVDKPHRGTIFVEDAEILAHQAFPGEQYVLRVKAPKCAAHASPGSFVHITCDPALPMRRPMSIMRVSREAGWVEMLYKAIGEGTRLLAQRHVGDVLGMLGPIGVPFTPDPSRPRALLIGGGVGIPPMVFIAQWIKENLRNDKSAQWKPFVIMGSEVPFPFKVQPSSIMVTGLPDGVIGGMPLMDDWGIPSRLASLQGYAGCFEGYVTDLARHWLHGLDETQRGEVAIYSCGPTPMLAAVAKLAREFDLPCQVSLEEHMACAVGGCAGCAVRVETSAGPAMKKVCVDGPVFDAYKVFAE
ncbi:MAG TPA: dihydroorotate dehydrogenase electron transfer subunit [Gammaproteobacteria bacterium]